MHGSVKAAQSPHPYRSSGSPWLAQSCRGMYIGNALPQQTFLLGDASLSFVNSVLHLSGNDLVVLRIVKAMWQPAVGRVASERLY